MNLTKHEKDVLKAMDSSSSREVWAIECDTEITACHQISGVISSLIKKGIAKSVVLDGETGLEILPEYHYLLEEVWK